MIKPLEMATIYWRQSLGRGVFEVTSLIGKIKSPQAKAYWNEVLSHLSELKNKKRGLH